MITRTCEICSIRYVDIDDDHDSICKGCFRSEKLRKLLDVVEAAKEFNHEKYCTGHHGCPKCYLSDALKALEAE